MPTPTATSNPNYTVFDKFSIAHASAGALLGFTPLPWWGVLALTVGFEVVEPWMQDAFPQWRLSSTRETTANAIGDVAIAMLTWWLVKRVP